MKTNRSRRIFGNCRIVSKTAQMSRKKIDEMLIDSCRGSSKISLQSSCLCHSRARAWRAKNPEPFARGGPRRTGILRTAATRENDRQGSSQPEPYVKGPLWSRTGVGIDCYKVASCNVAHIHFKRGSWVEIHLAARIAEAASTLLPSIAGRPPGGFCR